MCQNHVKAESENIDSVLKNIQYNIEIDTNSIESLLELAWKYHNSNPEIGLKYAEEARKVSVIAKDQLYLAKSLSLISTNYVSLANYKEALDAEIAALIIYKKLNYKRGIAKSYLNLGIVDYYLEKFEETIESWRKSAEIYEQLGDTNNLKTTLSNLGSVYRNQRNFEKAIECFSKALNLINENDELSKADIYNNLGNTYNDLSAFENEQSNIEKALLYLSKAESIFKAHNESLYYAYTLFNKSTINTSLGNISQAEKQALEALNIFIQFNSKEDINQAYSNLAEIYLKKHDYKKAYQFLDSNFAYTIRLHNEENEQYIAEIQTKFQTNQRIQENELLKIDNELQKSELEKQLWIKQGMVIGIITLIIIATLIFIQFRQKQKANTLLNAQNDEIRKQKSKIEKQNSELERKNRDITSGIQYARRIQTAIMPDMEFIKENFSDSFVFYKPKEIVSGDFYWFEKVGSKMFWSVVDCTGHGVSGAFMSILGVNGLKRIIIDNRITEPAEILTHLTDYVVSSLRESKEGIGMKDGMDMALCCYDEKTGILEFAGANNPLILIQGDKFNFIRGTRRPVGRTFYDDPPPFENHEFKVGEGDKIYVFSDGLPDQFGGKKGLKFSYRRLKELVMNNHEAPFNNQLEILTSTYLEWKGEEEQIDDICLFGVKI